MRPVVPALLLVVPYLLSCSGSQGPPGPRPVPVTVEQVTTEDVPDVVESVGNVIARETVEVKALVTGQILAVHIADGADLHKGDLLFEIDPGPYSATLGAAEGTLAKDRATAANAATEVTRYKPLVERKLAAPDQLSQLEAAAAAAAGAVRADEAIVRSNALQLNYCRIYSPIDGVAGAILVDVGNVVKANDATLVTINEVIPIEVSFTVPEAKLEPIRENMAAGPLEVSSTPPGEGAEPEQGTLVFVDNTVDPTIGSIALRGRFANVDRKLWPGQFVTVKLFLSMRQDATVVSTRAIQSGQKGSYVYVVKDDGTASLRVVTPGAATDDHTVIETGLQKGEKVVVDGELGLAPGMPVTVRPSSASTSTAPALGDAR